METLGPLEIPKNSSRERENPFKFSVNRQGSGCAEIICDNSDDTPTPTGENSDDTPTPTAEKRSEIITEWNTNENKSGQISTAIPFHSHSVTKDYIIGHEVVGTGESGSIIACSNKRTNQKCVLKILRDCMKSRREVELHFFASSHENIIKITDIYENTLDSVKYILVVLEYAEGGDLLTRFEAHNCKPYSQKKVGEIMRQIGSAIKFLHDRNIAHRDIKLENILCSSKGEDCIYKLADFGFAQQIKEDKLLATPCCTPFYVAPEILIREHYDKSCDLWALGVLTYILLCGYPPFYSMKGPPLSPGMKMRIVTGDYNFPPAEWDRISQSAKDVIQKLLVTDPSARINIDEYLSSDFVTGRSITEIGEGDNQNGDFFRQAEDTDQKNQNRFKSAASLSSVRLLNEGKRERMPPHFSIREEVGRAMEMMRLGNDHCYIKHPKESKRA